MASILHPSDATQITDAREPQPTQFFTEAMQRQLAADDSAAWRGVSGILMTIVAVGLLIVIAAVAFSV